MTAGRRLAVLLLLSLLALPRLAESQSSGWVIKSFRILAVPGPPPGQVMWDTAFNPFTVHPDIEVCVATSGRICADVCDETDSENPNRQCERPLGPRGLRLPRSGSVHVEAWDIDAASPRQLMADGNIAVTDECFPAEGASAAKETCEIQTPRGPLVIHFEMAFDGTSGVPALPGSPSRTAPGPGESRPVAPGDIDGQLNDLRDADNCRGSDQFFPNPQGTIFTRLYRNFILGSSGESDDYYALAALAASIPDPATRDRMKRRIQRRVDDAGNLPLYLDIVRDFESSQSWHAAFVKVAETFAGKLASKGLDKLVTLPTFARPEYGLAAEAERWIYKKLSTDKLADEAIDLIFHDRALTTECVMNELAKRGFEDAVARR